MSQQPDIIDNRERNLSDLLCELLPDACEAHFASGYFFLSGFQQVAGHIGQLDKLRLLIGNTSNRQTVEQLAEGYARLEAAKSQIDKARFQTPAQKAERNAQSKQQIGGEIAALDQSDAGEKFVRDLASMIASGRLEVRVYTKARLHAKAYIFDWHQEKKTYGANGIAVVGSSNFTLSGIRENTELNVVVHDQNGNHAALKSWFDELWDEAEEFDAALMEELQKSWATALPTPWQIYVKTLLALVGDRLDGQSGPEIGAGTKIEAMLTDFQRDAVHLAERYIEKWGGCFVSDVVGLGKSFIGAAICKRYEQLRRARVLIICPKPLEEMWERYNEEFELNAKVVPMSELNERADLDLSDYEARDFVLIDESHSFRNAGTQRYEMLDEFLADGSRKVCLLTATPLNARPMDVYHQLKLFHREERTALAIDPPDLKQFFGAVEKKQASLTSLLPQILIRRRRQDVLRLYGFAGDTDTPLKSLSDGEVRPYLQFQKKAYVFVGGRKQFFPRRHLETWRYSIEDTYGGLYEELRKYLGGAGQQPKSGVTLTYARYGLWNYVLPSKQKSPQYRDLQSSGVNLRGLIRTMLFKRFESSVCAFQKTLERLIASQSLFLAALEKGTVAAGKDAQQILRLSSSGDEEELLEKLEDVSSGYKAEDFRADDLAKDIAADIALLKQMLARVKPIEAANDAKLQTFLKQMRGPLKNKKVLVFTSYIDTANYIFSNGIEAPNTDLVASKNKNKSRAVARFAPKANRVVWEKHESEGELKVLVATDVLAEGLNMQDCDIIVNYDLHWNPVRLIQRFGRIDRIGSEHDEIYGYNFLPETGIEKNLGIEAVLAQRIKEIHATLGEDAAILHPDEALNEAGMKAIYTGEGGAKGAVQGDLFSDPSDRDELAFLNEAEVFLRNLRDNEPEAWKALLDLREGVRSAKVEGGYAGKKIIICRAGDYVQMYLADAVGKILSRDPSIILPLLETAREVEAPAKLPPDHNAVVMKVREEFARETKMRRAQREQTRRATPAQKWISERLLELFRQSEDEALKTQIGPVEAALRADGLPRSVQRELAQLHKRKLAGEELWQEAAKVYTFHDLKNRAVSQAEAPDEWPQIVCSLALM
jgi:superfamily II DNA or RNA helicase